MLLVSRSITIFIFLSLVYYCFMMYIHICGKQSLSICDGKDELTHITYVQSVFIT